MVITLTQGQLCIVDAQDWPLVKDLKWCAWRPSRTSTTFYAATGYRVGPNKWRTKLMHQIILPDIPPGCVRDHINGIGTDNRRENLRICTRGQNNRNRIGSLSGTSKYRGVSWNTNAGKWVAQIKCDGEQIALGLFAVESEAALAYDDMAIELFGDFARLNFFRVTEAAT